MPAEELQGRPLADLHLLAAEHGIPRFRMLRREQLVAALGGGEVAAPPPPAAVTRRAPAERRPRRRERRDTDDVSLEDLERPDERARGGFDELPVQRPSRPLELGDALGARMVQIVAPAGLGQRAMIAGPAGSGATALLQEFASGMSGAGRRVHVVLVDVRPEEVPEWEGRADVAAADASSSPREQVALAERVLEDAKRAAADGADAIVLLDSLSRLARAYGLTLGSQPDALEATKRWFSAARDGGSGHGSLTVIAAARVETESGLDALVYDALEDSANMVVRLSAALAAQGKYPAIDPSRSRTLGEEVLLDAEHRRALENMRGVARSLDPEEAWDFLAERAQERT